MKASVLVIASMFFAPSVLSQPDSLQFGAVNLKVLSWNIYMLPGIVSSNQAARAEAIGELLATTDYDIIAFQEAFHRKARKIISRHLQPAFSFQAGPANQKGIAFRTHSGLWVFSKHPIVATHTISFRTRKGADALSRKGALLIEIEVGQERVQIINTHLQNAGDPWLKHSQCVELFHRLLKVHQRHGVPQIVCGDFNFNRHEDSDNYHQVLKTLDGDDGNIASEMKYSYDRQGNDLHVERGNKQELIDYILVRSNRCWFQSAERYVRRFQKRWHKSHADLSDHYPIEALLQFQNQTRVVVLK